MASLYGRGAQYHWVVPAADDYDDSPYDSSDNEDKRVHPLALPGVKSKKKAYNVYWGRSTGTYTSWSSTEIQVKYFSGACYEGFPSVEDALAAWDISMASNAIGPPPAGAPCRRCRNLQPSTSSQTNNSIPSLSPISTPSRRGTSPPSTPVRSAARASGSALSPSSPSSLTVSTAACASGSALSPSSASSLTVSTHDPPATPSSHGSAARFTSITAALEGLNVDAYYVVIQGRKPGVYTSRYFSAPLAATYVVYVAWWQLESSPTQCL
ncbi:hypothetical protein K443DRAFT_7134 [Laccaria amethystina LaAM-08-1]|uniref:Ribonuclease H1 N-terminal domain-containing protein n=1 Tax=Laccaria amethystina LaAM-08-1 TaxID=1095629 RepID=A0A0C9XI37_9AGAR|nr:hypothetical protein K443DRAFT_7134 [Laccaria amethystina LaAM-08-1]